jgi:four helix bundle protein
MAANYRAAGRSRLKAEFIAKLGVVVEEADETVFWLEMLGESGIVRPAKLQALLAEATQLVAIFTASRNTARN